MIYVFYGKLLLLAIVCIISTITDIKTGIVKNILIFPAMIVGLVVDIVLWSLYPESLFYFGLNIIIAVFLSILLYAFRIWAGGDCKLMIAAALLLPFELYPNMFNHLFCVSMILVGTFIISFIFLLGDSIYYAFKQKRIIRKEKLLLVLKNHFLHWISCYPYVLLLVLLLNITVFRHAEVTRWTLIGISILAMMIVSGIPILKKKIVFIPVFVIAIGLRIFLEKQFFSASFWFCILATFVVVILRAFIEEYNYATINTSEVTKGMILSASTILLFSNAKIKGLPTAAYENLKGRLTEDEAASVRKWGESKNGLDQVQIVRKMPFVIFLTLGIIVFITLGLINNGYLSV